MLGLIDGVGAPNLSQNLAMRQRAIGVLREQRQQLEFLRREANLLRAALQAAPIVIDRELTRLHLPADGFFAWSVAAQSDADSRQELRRAERFRHVVVG